MNIDNDVFEWCISANSKSYIYIHVRNIVLSIHCQFEWYSLLSGSERPGAFCAQPWIIIWCPPPQVPAPVLRECSERYQFIRNVNTKVIEQTKMVNLMLDFHMHTWAYGEQSAFLLMVGSPLKQRKLNSRTLIRLFLMNFSITNIQFFIRNIVSNEGILIHLNIE